ncbi:sulfatase-like hydrolase/transferase [uncultured Draconibacterium sp.]|uniref:sulfatase-like hydrolase/transferase n=1 Tax=uncultured Draconibacterium sp. TaxID=1573823 RepID=UPI00326084E7
MLKFKSLFTGLFFALLLTSCSKNQPQPNILWIYSDDIGLELGCYGNPDVKTPNIDALAAQGVRYTKAYTTTSVCSSSRSSIITGMYPTAINSLEHRTINKLPLPDHIQPVTEYFKAAGYFCSNMDKSFEKMGKTDFNFETDNIFDAIDWKDRNKGQPFYAQVNIKYPHRDFEHDSKHPIDYKSVTVPACYPDHELIRADWAMYLESIQHLDEVIGNITERLKAEGRGKIPSFFSSAIMAVRIYAISNFFTKAD